MTEYRLYRRRSGEILEVVYQLREQGLQQGTDFDFEWHVETIEKSHGRFKFYTEQWGTWFALKYL